MTITVRTREDLRSSIKNFIVINKKLSKSSIVEHFVKQGFKRRTIYNNIKRVNECTSTKDGKRTGRKPAFSLAKLAKLKKLSKNRIGVSQRDFARQFSVSQSTIGRKLKQIGLKYRKRQKAPKYSEKQPETIRTRARKLINRIYSEKIEDFEIILDDEKYFEFCNNDIPKNTGIYTDNIKNCPNEVRFKPLEKFPTKILVWVALSGRGLSASLIRPSKSRAVNKEVYLNDCLIERLLPFIERYHSDGKYLFWPDLASAHYAKDVQDWMRENVKFVEKYENPPNVPQCRPIESFWGVLTQKVYDEGWQAETEKQLVRRINVKLKEFDEKSLQTLMSGIKGKLRKLADEGVYGLFEKLNINN